MLCLICWTSILFIAHSVRAEVIYSLDGPVLQEYLWSGFILIWEVRWKCLHFTRDEAKMKKGLATPYFLGVHLESLSPACWWNTMRFPGFVELQHIHICRRELKSLQEPKWPCKWWCVLNKLTFLKTHLQNRFQLILNITNYLMNDILDLVAFMSTNNIMQFLLNDNHVLLNFYNKLTNLHRVMLSPLPNSFWDNHPFCKLNGERILHYLNN